MTTKNAASKNLSNKILIVDDEAFIRLLIEQALEDLQNRNVEILSANNGEQALTIIQEEKPRLVFLDVMIPKMNGYDVCRFVKHKLKMQDVSIVILTAKGQMYDKQLGEQAGADRFMTKPFDPDELVSLAEEILGL